MSYYSSDTKQSAARKRDIKLIRKCSNESQPASTTQLRLGQEKTSGRLSLERKAWTPASIQRRLARGNLAAGKPMVTAKKLKFLITAENGSLVKSTKLAKSKTIVKKPATSFDEFRLSH